MGTRGAALSPGRGEGGTATGVHARFGDIWGSGGVAGPGGLFPVGIGGLWGRGERGGTLGHCPRVACPGGHRWDHWGHRWDHWGHRWDHWGHHRDHWGHHRDSATTCQHRAGNTPGWLLCPSQGRGDREGLQGTPKASPEDLGCPQPLGPGTAGIWGQTAASVPAHLDRSHAAALSVPGVPRGQPSYGDTPSCGDTPRLWGQSEFPGTLRVVGSP